MKLENVRTNYEYEFRGVEDHAPVFSWELKSEKPNTYQRAYQVIVKCGEDCVWDSGMVESDASQGILYQGAPLQSRSRYDFCVQIRDNHDQTANASSWFETALKEEDWQAEWIEPELPPIREEKKINITQATLGTYKKTPPESRLFPCSCLRREFCLEKKPVQARLYMTVHGTYHVELNGKNVDQRYLAPEFTVYPKNLLYQIYDITEYVRKGENAVGVTIADGWWGGRYGMNGGSCEYGNKHALLLQMEIMFEDGTKQVICSDEQFKAGYGHIRYADIFIGEKHDANERIDGWSEPGFDDSDWKAVKKADYALDNLHPQTGSPVRAVRRFPVKEILRTPNGDIVVDVGENIAGFLRMKVNAPKGTVVKLEHGEVLSKNGNFCSNVQGRNKDQVDVYVCGGGEEVFEPRFTFHGFRYARVTGYPGIPTAKDFECVVLSSVDIDREDFETSDIRLNQLQHCILNSETANMLSIPTDCPQRERAGWTGDIQVFLKTAAFNGDINTFLARWLKDVEHEQTPEGAITHVVPYTSDYQELCRTQFKSDTSSGWGDAGVILPWQLYLIYGNKQLLERQYHSMQRWMEYVISEAAEHAPKKWKAKNEADRERQKYLWNTGFHYGDHNVPSITKKMGVMAMFGIAVTRPLVASAYYAHTAELMTQAAHALGKEEDERRYREIAHKAKKAFQEEYFTEKGRLTPDWMGCYAIALGFDLVPDRWKESCLDRMEELIEKNGGCHDCGFLSVEHILEVFSKNGRWQRAYRLLYQDKMPSWLYEVKMGATSIWEAWDAVKPDGKTGDFSYNHYAFGCVGDWMYRNLLGIQNGSVGYKEIVIAPKPDDSLTYAKGRYHSVYGEIRVAWEQKELFVLETEIPANTAAIVQMPDGTCHRVGSGTWKFQCERRKKE